MASTINTQTTPFAAIVQTADDTGNLALQTANVTAVTIDTSQNVGIGTTSPAAKLVSSGSSSTIFKALILRNEDGTTGSSAAIDFEASAGTQGDEASMAGRIAGVRTGSGTSGALTFGTTNAGVLGEQMRITSAGGVSFGSSGTAYGTSGQVLQSNGNAPPTWAAIPSSSGGSTVTSSSVTLNTSASRLQFISNATAITTATLAAATTFSDEGSNLFQVKNNSVYVTNMQFSDGWYGNSINPGKEVYVSLADNSSAVAGWTYTNDPRLKIKPPASFTAAGCDASYRFDIAVMTDTTVICVFSGTSADIYYSVGTITDGVISWGSPTLMFTATAYRVWLTRLTDTTAILQYESLAGANPNGTINTYGLTLSGSTITQSAAGATSTTSILCDAVRLDNTRALYSYVSASATVVRVVTHNGASAPTFGTAATIISSAAIDGTRSIALTLVDTDKAVAFYTDADSATPVFADAYARVCSVSGTTVSFGTQLTLSASDSTYCLNKQAYSFDSSYAFNTDGWGVSISGTTLTSLGLIAPAYAETNFNTSVVPMSSTDAILDNLYRGKYISGAGALYSNTNNLSSNYLSTPDVIRTNAAKTFAVAARISTPTSTISAACIELIET
jgi:hypothetical protein